MIKINWRLISKFIEKHGPAILSWMAVGGTVLTGYFTHKATEKTTLELSEIYERPENSEMLEKDLKKEHLFKEGGWKNYISSGIAGIGTIACIIGANYWHLSKESALTAAVAFYKASESELAKAVKEKYGDEAFSEIKKDISKKKIEDDRPPWEPKNSNKMTIYEPYTKQWFQASQQELLWAELTANRMLQQSWSVTLNDILALYPGCKKTKMGKTIGWSLNDECFQEAVSYSPSGIPWITLVPQSITNPDGSTFFQMEYEIHPDDITEALKLEDKL